MQLEEIWLRYAAQQGKKSLIQRVVEYAHSCKLCQETTLEEFLRKVRVRDPLGKNLESGTHWAVNCLMHVSSVDKKVFTDQFAIQYLRLISATNRNGDLLLVIDSHFLSEGQMIKFAESCGWIGAEEVYQMFTVPEEVCSTA